MSGATVSASRSGATVDANKSSISVENRAMFAVQKRSGYREFLNTILRKIILS